MNQEKKQVWSSEDAIARGKTRLARLHELSKLSGASVTATKPIPSKAPEPIEAIRSRGYVKPIAMAVPVHLPESETGELAEFARNDKHINWAYWVGKLPKLNADEACRLMCGLDPEVFRNLDIYKDLNQRPNNNNPSEACDKAKGMLRLAQREDKTFLTPTQWMEWATEKNYEVHAGYRLALSTFAVKSKTEPAPAPIEFVSAKGEQPKAAQLPLTTGDIAFCFDGLRWTEKQWKKPLGDKPKWLQTCIQIPGQRGISETRWNPVFIGAALVLKGHAKQTSVRARFQTKPLLKPWLEAWKTYEAENIENK